MSKGLREKLKVYELLHGYTKKATKKAISELGSSINDPQNESVVEALKTRKTELENALAKLESFED